jgi:hypothetical protein
VKEKGGHRHPNYDSKKDKISSNKNDPTALKSDKSGTQVKKSMNTSIKQNKSSTTTKAVASGNPSKRSVIQSSKENESVGGRTSQNKKTPSVTDKGEENDEKQLVDVDMSAVNHEETES